MKNQTCCFTGHRVIEKEKSPKIEKRLEEEIINLIYQGICYFATGGALGFDTIAAMTVLKLKNDFPHIRLILVLPCKDQQEFWEDSDKKIYGQILNEADKVVYTSEYYHKGCMHKRNRHLANNSSICVCYLTKQSGGTAYTVDYARKIGCKIINIADFL